jgi:hypothetical protein
MSEMEGAIQFWTAAERDALAASDDAVAGDRIDLPTFFEPAYAGGVLAGSERRQEICQGHGSANGPALDFTCAFFFPPYGAHRHERRRRFLLTRAVDVCRALRKRCLSGSSA